MRTRSDSSLAALLLTQRLVETSAAPLKSREYWSVLTRTPDPASLLGLDVADVRRAVDGNEDLAQRIVTLLDAATSLAFELEKTESSGVRLLASVDEDYPTSLVERLGPAAPPLLYVAGDPLLLHGPLLGVVGSRDVSREGADAAREVAMEAAKHGIGVVSGGAKGVDGLAMQAALDADAPVVGVLAESLLRATRDAEVRRAITDGRLCLGTPYKPSAGFSVANAMGRNKLIYALSRATVVVASDLDSGGTWAGAVEALRHGIAPVLVWTGHGAGPGNARIVERGGTPIASVEALFPLPERPERTGGETDAQLSLEL
jgi:predicted Rossmann fold nucleotide-binding protein DprA/Smf involved in DNA uptake